MGSHTCHIANGGLYGRPPCAACQDDYLAKYRLKDEEAALSRAVVDAAMTVSVLAKEIQKVTGSSATPETSIRYWDALRAEEDACAALAAFRERGK